MSTTRLLETKTKTYSDVALVKYVNNRYNKSFGSIVTALTGLGTSTVTAVVATGLASSIATALGLGIAFTTVVDVVESGLKSDGLGSVLSRMKKGQSLKVTTKFYEWSSGNGNSYTYYSKETFSLV